MIAAAIEHARDLHEQGLSEREAAEHAARQFDVSEADVLRDLHAWRKLPVEFLPATAGPSW